MRLDKILKVDNIAKEFNTEKLNKIGAELSGKFNEDVTARDKKDRALKEAEKIAKQMIESKSFPFENASNVKYPLITKAVIEFNSRVMPIICNNGEPVKIKTFGDNNDVVMDETGAPELSQETGVFATKQEGIIDRAKKVKDVMNWVLSDKTSWEDEKDRLTLVYALSGFAASKNYFDYTDALPKSETVTPLCLYWEKDKSFYEASRKSQIISLAPNEILGGIRSGVFVDRGDWFESIKDEDLVELVECHCWLDLDDDGYKEPYIVTFTKEKGTVLRISRRFDAEDIVYNRKGEIVKIKPKEYFVFYQFMPCLDGSCYPLGLADLLLFINNAINANVNQLIDSGTLANIQGGFISGIARIRGGRQSFNAGEFKFVDNAGLDITKSIVPLPTKEPSQTLFQLLGFLVDAGKDVAMLSDVLTGNIQPNIPASTTLAMIEQGLSGFKAILKRLNRALKQEMRLIYDMIDDNIDYIKRRYANTVVLQNVNRGDFADDYAIVPVADEYYSTSIEKSQRAEFFLSLATGGNPYINGLEATTRALNILGVDHADDLIVKPQPQQPDPLAIAQLQVLQADIQRKSVENQIDFIKVNLEKMRTDSEIINNSVKTQSETIKRNAEAVNALATAESKEAGIDNPAYIAQAKNMNLFTNTQAKDNINEQTNGQTQGIQPQGLGTIQNDGAGQNPVSISDGQLGGQPPADPAAI